MGLATAPLERGDGEWENIQDVLRHAFLAHETQLRRHANRLDGCERHCNELSAQWSSVQSLSTHVDKLARVMDSLSEKLKQRAYADEERERQQAKWMESVSRVVETHVEKLQTRVLNDMETKCNKIMATLERRMELVEEELGHFVEALERKADLDVVKANKQAMEEALKQRCRKAAFDKEVLHVHQLLRTQHARMNQRIEALQNDLQQQVEMHLKANQQQQQQSHDTKGEETRQQQQVEQLRLREEIMDAMTNKLKAVQDALTLLVQTQVTSAQETAAHLVENLVAEQHDVYKQRLNEVDTCERVAIVERDWSDWQQHTAATKEELSSEIVSLREELATTMQNVEERLDQHKRDVTEARADIETRFARVQEESSRLEFQLSETSEMTKQQLAQLESVRIYNEQRQLAHRDELRQLATARDKKTRQQMHVVADKLREMDQILKLLGRQLVQNTSQLQLLWVDAHEEVEGHGEVGLIEAGDAVMLQAEGAVVATVDPLAGHGDEADALQRSSHEQLQASIEAKLRDYEMVLFAKDMTNNHTEDQSPV